MLFLIHVMYYKQIIILHQYLQLIHYIIYHKYNQELVLVQNFKTCILSSYLYFKYRIYIIRNILQYLYKFILYLNLSKIYNLIFITFTLKFLSCIIKNFKFIILALNILIILVLIILYTLLVIINLNTFITFSIRGNQNLTLLTFYYITKLIFFFLLYFTILYLINIITKNY